LSLRRMRNLWTHVKILLRSKVILSFVVYVISEYNECLSQYSEIIDPYSNIHHNL
jgi:hypothetical protein